MTTSSRSSTPTTSTTSSRCPTPTISRSPTPTISRCPTPTISRSPTPTFSRSPSPTMTTGGEEEGGTMPDLTSCQLCEEKFDFPPGGLRVPKLLHCLHTCCLSCLTTLWGNTHSRIDCSICRAPTLLSQEGPKVLIDNFVVLRAMELETLQSNESIPCDECAEGEASTATHRCQECVLYLCALHQAAHRKGKKTVSHLLLTVEEVKQRGDIKVKPVKHTCPIHDEELKLYCETCRKLICRDCTLRDHPLPSHQFDFITKVGANQKQHLLSLLEQTDAHVPKFENSLQSVTKMLTKVSQQESKIRKEIEDAFALIRADLNQRERLLIEKLKTLSLEKKLILTKQCNGLSYVIENFQQASNYTKDLCTKGSEAEILLSRTQIETRLKLLSEIQIETAPGTSEVMSMQIDVNPIRNCITDLGLVYKGAVAPALCRAEGPGLSEALAGKENKFSVVAFTTDSHQLSVGGELLEVDLLDEEKASRLERVEVKDNKDGSYSILYTPRGGTEGRCSLVIKIRGGQIYRSPFSVLVKDPWTWNPERLGANAVLKGENFTLSTTSTGEWDRTGALGTKMFSSREHYWEIKVEKDEDAMIGVARPSVNLARKALRGAADVAFVNYSGHLYGGLGTKSQGINFKTGDTIGFHLLATVHSTYDLYVYTNRQNRVKAFTNIPIPVVAIGEIYDTAVQLTLNSKASRPS